MKEPQSTPPERPQFSILQMLGLLTFATLLIGILTIGFQSKSKTTRLRAEIDAQRQLNEDLRTELRISTQAGRRSGFTEKMLLHVFANLDQYPELKHVLETSGERKLDISLHGLSDDDGLSLLAFTTKGENESEDGDETAQPFCLSVLIQEKPFQVLDCLAGPRHLTPKVESEKWMIGVESRGVVRWYSIINQKFETSTDVDPRE